MYRRFLALMAISFFGTSTAWSGLVFTFSEAGDGGVDLLVTGSGTLGGSTAVSTIWSISDITNSDLSPNFNFINTNNGATFPASAFSGSYSVNNVMESNYAGMNFQLQDGGGGAADSIVFVTGEGLDVGETYSFNSEVHWTVTDLPFSSLNGGAYTATGVDAGRLGNITISVPEPSASLLCVFGCTFLYFSATRRSRKRL